MITLTTEEKSILGKFAPLKRIEIIDNLKTSIQYYNDTEKEEKRFAENLLQKLQAMTDTEYNKLSCGDNLIDDVSEINILE